MSLKVVMSNGDVLYFRFQDDSDDRLNIARRLIPLAIS